MKTHVRYRIRRVSTVALAAPLLVLAALPQGCFSPNSPLDAALIASAEAVECSTLELTYENFGAAFMARYCGRCHSSSISGDLARSDAPVGIDFDTLEGIRSFASRIKLRTGELGDMPPALLGGERPTEDERVKLIQWITCGTPSEADLTP